MADYFAFPLRFNNKYIPLTSWMGNEMKFTEKIEKEWPTFQKRSWCTSNDMVINTMKSKSMIMGSSRKIQYLESNFNIFYENVLLNDVKYEIIDFDFIVFITISLLVHHDRFWNVGQANYILKDFENMMIDHSHSTIF
jgi:hypothetical protein